VERERQRLLRAHAEELSQFLPRGVFRNETDYEAVMGEAPRNFVKPEDRTGISYNSLNIQ
jgi:hypothetical protein